jgi:hypothetical protein
MIPAAQTLALTMDGKGETNYDAVAKQAQNAKKHVHSSHGELIPKPELTGRNVSPHLCLCTSSNCFATAGMCALQEQEEVKGCQGKGKNERLG